MHRDLRLLRAVLPHAGRTARKRVRRHLLKLRLALTKVDPAARIRAERRLRGREEFERLERADAVVVSYGKSGRTWLRVMVSRLYQQTHGLPEDTVINFDNFHDLDSRIPRIFFTHDTYIEDYTGNTDSKAHFHGRKVVLMVRDPRDVAISTFFQWRFRMPPEKKALKDYPPHDDTCEVFDFVCHEGRGLPRIICFMNRWAREIDDIAALELVRYEDMRSDPHEVLSRVARFLDIPATDKDIADAVSYAAYDNMKKMEAGQTFRMSGRRVVPGDRGNPDSYKVRRAKVGGYRDYLDEAQVARVDDMVADTLDPLFGYGTEAAGPS